MLRFTITRSDSMPSEIDTERCLLKIPPSYAVKGLFFERYVERLGSDYASLKPSLLGPPRVGRYMPFLDYPQVDYMRIVHAVARKVHPNVTHAEAIRRVSRVDYEVLSKTRFGSIVVALVNDPVAALMNAPALESRLLKLGPVATRRLGERSVRMEFRRRADAVTGYMVGLVEGLVGMFSIVPTVEVTVLSDDDADYELRW